MTKEKFSKIKTMEASVRKRLLRLNPDLTDGSGIYIWLRDDEDGIKYAYIGQSKNILARQVQHILGQAQMIDMGLRQRGLYDAERNPYGYRLGMLPYAEADLDAAERHYILLYARAGYQIQNRTTGGKKGKRLFGDKRPTSERAQGIVEGRRQMAQEILEIAETLRIEKDEELKRRFWELLSEGEERKETT